MSSCPPIDFVTGFRGADGKTRGRPVGVSVDPRGALIVADDLSNTVWRVTPVRLTAADLRPHTSMPAGLPGFEEDRFSSDWMIADFSACDADGPRHVPCRAESANG